MGFCLFVFVTQLILQQSFWNLVFFLHKDFCAGVVIGVSEMSQGSELGLDKHLRIWMLEAFESEKLGYSMLSCWIPGPSASGLSQWWCENNQFMGYFSTVITGPEHGSENLDTKIDKTLKILVQIFGWQIGTALLTSMNAVWCSTAMNTGLESGLPGF